MSGGRALSDLDFKKQESIIINEQLIQKIFCQVSGHLEWPDT
jgi:hypothetical protein